MWEMSPAHGYEAGSTTNRTCALVPSKKRRPPPAKRAQVLAACQHCRVKRIKCDGLRPCSQCITREVVCQYETERGESTTQAAKRKHGHTAQQLEMYQQLVDLIKTRDDNDVAEIVRLVRSGYSPKTIVQHAGTDRVRGICVFLTSLAHSTGSLGQISRLAITMSTSFQVLDPRAMQTLCNRIVRISDLENILQRSQRAAIGSPSFVSGVAEPSLLDHHSMVDGSDEPTESAASTSIPPPHQLPAKPWTSLADDDAVSHLISLFMAWVNPYWRFVEADIFLKDMHAKRTSSQYCSPFLVNSILAIASLHSEHDAAFSEPTRDRIARGLHFHHEAMRLWELENSRPTITNVQALCILALESNLRANDALGLSLVQTAVQFDSRLPVQNDLNYCQTHGIGQIDCMRVRLGTHWMAKCTHVVMRIAFLNGTPAETPQEGFPRIYDVFNDEIENWTEYPYTTDAIAYSPTLCLRERCRLAELFEDIHSLVLTKGKSSESTVQGFIRAVESLLARMQHWYHRLPFELQYRWPMSVAVWELHASYFGFCMVLQSQARARLQQKEATPAGQLPLTETDRNDGELASSTSQLLLSNSIPLAHQSARMLRDFRERWGLKIGPAWFLLLQAVAAGILLLDPDLDNTTNEIVRSPSTMTTEDADDRSISDSSAAFDEVFRCLLGTGVEVMVTRAIARMTYHTAVQYKVAFSSSTKSLLKIMSETAWRPSDVRLVDSSFPNFATTRGYDGSEERMSELLAKWETLEL